MHRNQSVNVHQFAMVPRADIPRSGFKIQTAHKTTFDAGWLIPVYCTEVLPGDTFNLRMTAFCRLATPIVPIMDNMYLDTFFFFVPNRLVWDNWARFMGEQPSPGDSTDFLVPIIDSGANGFSPITIYDYFGIPTSNQTSDAIQVNALPLRAYNLIWNEWFRDQNLQAPVPVDRDDGPDAETNYSLLQRGKRHDYFTSCLPWVQKGPSIPLALGGYAPLVSDAIVGGNGRPSFDIGANTRNLAGTSGSRTVGWSGTQQQVDADIASWNTPGLVADLGAATAATINQIRQSFQVQKLLERDARGGTRYTEIVRSHFGVISPDARLQRPEYLGGGTTPINIHPVAQTSGTADAAGGYTPTPQGNLSAFGTALASQHGFSQSFTEHGYIIGLASVRADLNYQQGLRKMWSRRTRYDFYFPVFAHLGEQAVLNREIFATGTAQDDAVFGYQERWAEYRYQPSIITGWMNSTATEPLDVWHLAQNFTALPVLDDLFIRESPPLDRVLAVPGNGGQQFLADMFFNIRAVRPMPMYSVPGLVDHF